LNGNYTEFEAYMFEARRKLNENIKSLLLGMKELKLYPQARYALTSGGKRLRTILTIASGEAVGGESVKLFPLALSFELIHTATLIHDDIIDGDSERRGKPALHMEWRNKAILGGDALFVRAINILSEYGSEIVGVVTEAALEVCDGQFMDVTLMLREASQDDVLLKIRKKSAALFRAAAQCGALVGGGSRSEIEALKSYGENFGVAYQLADDLKEIKEGKFRDLESGRLTLPYLHLYEHGGSRLKSLLEEKFGSGKLSDKDVKTVLEGLEAYGSLEHSEEKIAEYVAKALRSLNSLREGYYKDFLKYFVCHCAGKEKLLLEV
jgi:octaprenyl-diphosphate synthase